MSIHGPGGMPGTLAANHSRAAVVCFGGWGLQTMLHVWPRLGLIQEERQALETAASLPDLDRLTAFAAIVPGAHAVAGEQVRLEVQAVRPAPDHCPPPGYLEGLLEAFQKWPAGAAAQGLTESELQGSRLLRCAQEAGVVQSLALVPMSSGTSLTGPVLPARSAMCCLGLDLAPAIAGALVREVIDATRLDGAQPYDPFVQTTIYVVASLAEAHATALMWPVLAELVAALGPRHIARVVGFFETGSFAGGASRAIEEAAVHVALQELETLIRPARPGAGAAALLQLVGAADRPLGDRPDADRPGPGPLLDAVYLVDREKNNQALAQSPQELAVLVGNALEAFLVTGGAELVEERLAAEVVGGRAFPYSALGTACDYVPLAEYIAAAIVGEQQQLICSEVLAATEKAGEDGTTLADLGAAHADALACAMDAGAALAFDRTAAAGVPAGGPVGPAEPGAAGWPGWLAGLRVAEDFLLPGAVARQLRQAQTAALWRKIAESRLAEATTELDGLCDAAEMAWGLSGTLPGPPASPSGDTGLEQGGAPGGALAASDGLAPRAAAAAVARLVEDICGASPGLLRARVRAARWTAQIESVLGDLARAKMPTESAGGQQGRMALWRREWNALGAGGVSEWEASAAGGALGLVAASILAGWLVWRSTVPISPLQLVAAVLAALAVALVSARAAWTIATWRVRRLKRDWILLAREHLAQHARRRLHCSLVRLYEQLHADLAALQASIEEAIAELAAWAEAGDGVSGRLPSQAGSAHLRLAHGSDRLWQTVREQITQATAQGENSRGEFGRCWLVQGRAPLHHQRREHGPSARVQAILRARIDQAKIGATGVPDPDRPAGGSALAAVYRDYAALATRYLGRREALLAGHAGLVRQVAREYDIERTLFGETEAPASDAGDHLPLAFLEQSYTRARPAANYEVISRFSRDAGDVEFGVTPEGSNSRLGNPARQRGIPLLASRDPLSVIFVRIVGGLALEDLTLAGRCRRAYQSISQADRDGLSLVPAAQTVEAASLYGTATGQP